MSKFINRLNDMFSHVESEPPLFTTIYEHNGARGEVNYELTHMVGVKKPIKQEFLITLSANMTRIIDSINNESPLTEEDMGEMNYDIMEHSKNMVYNYQLNNKTT
jgi:hypothetical protein